MVYLPLKVNFKETNTVHHCDCAWIIIDTHYQYQLQIDLNGNNYRDKLLNMIISKKIPYILLNFGVTQVINLRLNFQYR